MDEFSAKQAAQALLELDEAEEQLSQRMGGITTMIWGIISAAIFLAYGVAETTLEGGYQALNAVIWLPFVVAGAFVTMRLWQHNAIILGRRESGTLRDAALITAGFLALAAVLFFGARAAGITWDMDGIMTTVNGLMAGIIGVSLRRHGARGWSHLIGASIAMILGGVLLGVLELRTGLDVFAAAAICGFSWFQAGFAIHQQG